MCIRDRYHISLAHALAVANYRRAYDEGAVRADAKIGMINCFTPEKTYRYEIISAYTTAVNSDTYTLFKGPGQEFVDYMNKIVSYSDVKTKQFL